jgi:hypothetical protein
MKLFSNYKKYNVAKLSILVMLLLQNCTTNKTKPKNILLSKEYKILVSKAFENYEQKEFLNAARLYEKAFIFSNNIATTTDRYNAACSWALANNADNCFRQLQHLTNKMNYSDYDFTLQEDDFNALHQDKRWAEIINKILENKNQIEAKLNMPLVKILDTIFENDQKYRQQLNSFYYDKNNIAQKKLWDTIQKFDKINLEKVIKIIDKYGWLGEDVIGEKGNSTIFIVIQHADLATQDKYLPIMKEAVQKGNARVSDLALLIDRTEIEHNRKQIFGSQLDQNSQGKYILYPTIDTINIDARRDSVGLEPIEDYLSQFNK